MSAEPPWIELLPANAVLSADKHHVHVQAVASTVWTIDHGLNKKPSPVFLDTAGNVIEGAHLSYPTLNRMIAEWSSPFSGEAYLN